MAYYSAQRAAFTPSTSADNFSMYMNGGYLAVATIGWGGRGTGSAAYRTIWTRPTTNGVTFTAAATVQKLTPGAGNPAANFVTNWSTQPVLPAEPNHLFAQDWDVHGGSGYLMLPETGRWILCTTSTISHISCRNIVGTDPNLSTYWAIWEE